MENNKNKSPKTERVKKVIRWLIGEGIGKSQEEIGLLLGYSNKSAFSQVVNNESKMPGDLSSRLCSLSDKLVERWIDSGDGAMLKTDVKEPPDFLNANGSLYNIVPLWNFDAVGSMGKTNDVTDSPAYIEKYVAFPSARKDDFCVHVTGNSMIPTYCPGSLVLLREVQNWREYFGYGHCFMLFLNDGRRILKEVQKYVENSKEYVTCVSHNKEFPSEELPKNMIMSVYKVIATLNNEGF